MTGFVIGFACVELMTVFVDLALGLLVPFVAVIRLTRRPTWNTFSGRSRVNFEDGLKTEKMDALTWAGDATNVVKIQKGAKLIGAKIGAAPGFTRHTSSVRSLRTVMRHQLSTTSRRAESVFPSFS